MVSKEFLRLLSVNRARRQPSILESAETLAADLGFESFEAMMRMTEREELDEETEQRIFTRLGPLADLAYQTAEGMLPRPCQSDIEAIERLIAWVFRFLFGCTEQELADLRVQTEIVKLLRRIEQAELTRMEHQQAANQFSTDGKALLLRPFGSRT